MEETMQWILALLAALAAIALTVANAWLLLKVALKAFTKEPASMREAGPACNIKRARN